MAEKAQITIDCKPDADGSIEVVSQAKDNSWSSDRRRSGSGCGYDHHQWRNGYD